MSRQMIVLLIGTFALTPITAASAHAAVLYPWCVQFYGGKRGIGGTSCGFISYDQCMMTARGLGSCVENTAYPGPMTTTKSRHLKRELR
jgi:hypothetical protein